MGTPREVMPYLVLERTSRTPATFIFQVKKVYIEMLPFYIKLASRDYLEQQFREQYSGECLATFQVFQSLA